MPVRKRKTQKGAGLMSALKSVGSFIKKNKLLSRGLSMIPHPTAQKAAQMAQLVGLGKRNVKQDE